jgi:epoxyqueuosine reductase
MIAISSQLIREYTRGIGCHGVGITAIEPESIEVAGSRLQAWLAAGYHGDMAWMTDEKRRDARLLMPEVKSIVAIALNYYNDVAPPDDSDRGKISRYAWGRDYHKVVKGKLKQIVRHLQQLDPTAKFKYCVDTAPIQDKFWAQQAGLGWIAKNGNLITREWGSWVFLGEILTDLVLECDLPHHDRCGTCTRCLTACPTAAIVAPKVVDANRCIAYHTIENRAASIPEDISLHGWLAGCDICQEVCPWNQRFAKQTDIEDFYPIESRVTPLLAEHAKISDDDWDDLTRGSALRRIKPDEWRRNAKHNLAKSPKAAVDVTNLPSSG